MNLETKGYASKRWPFDPGIINAASPEAEKIDGKVKIHMDQTAHGIVRAQMRYGGVLFPERIGAYDKVRSRWYAMEINDSEA